jgi:hypothetical protein
VVIIFYFTDAGAFGRKEEKGEEKKRQCERKWKIKTRMESKRV